jgi:uncharacterized membrane protein (UPF0127 family)
MPTTMALLLDGHATGLAVLPAESLVSRAAGVWSERPWPADRVLLIPACRTVHTFALGTALDVVFTDEQGSVIALHTAVPPWRVRHHRAACATWEFAAGIASSVGVRPGARLQARRTRGATLVEFLMATMLVVLPMVFVTLELARLSVSRHALQHAVVDAAREAGFATQDGAGLRRSIAYGLLPLYVPTDPARALDRQAAGPDESGAAATGLAALGRAYGEALRPDLMEITLESADGSIFTPGAGPLDWPPTGGVWRLRVRHCRELIFPLARQSIPKVVRLGARSAFDQACLARERMPLEASALVLRPDRTRRPVPGRLPDLPPGDHRDQPVLPPVPSPPDDPVPILPPAPGTPGDELDR